VDPPLANDEKNVLITPALCSSDDLVQNLYSSSPLKEGFDPLYKFDAGTLGGGAGQRAKIDRRQE
jgi:hypothetical protein